ncbi:MAG: CoA transferase [Pseudomonadota bacterium]
MSDLSSRSGPLQNLTVIDCTMALAGPYGMSLLADLGADVIKVEPPHGDLSRSVPPTPPDYANVTSDKEAGVDYGGYFASINRNKRSIVLDLKQAEDRETLLRLCEHADAIVENMRAGVMDKLGVGYDVISQRNPRIVYGCIRGFGDPRTGESPYAHWPAYDIVAQCMSGLAHITGPADGSGGYPSGTSVGDIFPGTLMALGLLAGINHAKATGEGQFFDVGMYDAMLAFNETIVANYGYNQHALTSRGQHHPNLMPFGIFPTNDGGVAIAAPGPAHWNALCEIMQREDLISDERTRNVHLRARNQDFVREIVTQWTSSQTKKQVVAALGGKVPCGPVNTAADIFADPHVEIRGMVNRFQLPGDNPEVGIVGSPIKYTATPTRLYRRPPKLGEHTVEVMQQLDLWEQEGKAK